MEEVEYHYESRPRQEWTNKAFALQQEGRLTAVIIAGTAQNLVVAGECPRCGQQIKLNLAKTITAVVHRNLGESSSLEDDSARYERETVICNARPPAKGAPDDRLGCGACFSVYARLEPQQ